MTLKSFHISFFSTIVGVALLLSSSVQARSLPDFAALVEDHSAAVVKIETITRTQQSGGQQNQQGHPQLPGHLLEFLRPFLEQYRQAPQPEPQQGPQRNGRSMGSGFFISEDGFVLTNNHVVAGATDILVRMTDRREFDAEVIGLDPQSDLALLKVDAKGLPFLKLANSDKAKVGEWVLAIGSPFGLDYSVSAGIISAIGRSLPSSEQQNYVPFIQTDVAINPGNSGGPLFNLKGEVVGINSQIYTNSGGSIGLSFAIPSNLAKNVIKQLKDSGRVDRGWLGVVIQDVSKDLALSFGLKKPQGALIAQIDSTGPAARSGLKVSDIILSFNGKKIMTSSDLPHVVGPLKPGTTVPATVMRKGKEITLDVTVGSRHNPDVAQEKADDDKPESRLGVAVQELTEEIREAVGSGGVIISRVAPDSPAAKSGLQRGDVIVQLGFEDVTSLKQFYELEAALPTDEPKPIRFVRRGETLFRSILLTK